MKKLIVLAVLLLALSASMAMADSSAWFIKFDFTPGVTTWATTDTAFTYGLYVFDYDGGWTVTGRAGSPEHYLDAALYNVTDSMPDLNDVEIPGSSAPHPLVATNWLYKYFYTNDAGASWIEIGKMYQGNVYTGTTVGGSDYTTASTGAVYANGMRIMYGANASPTSPDSASGSLSMSARAVPEASTLVGFGSALAMAGPGMIGWLRRRKA